MLLKETTTKDRREETRYKTAQQVACQVQLTYGPLRWRKQSLEQYVASVWLLRVASCRLLLVWDVQGLGF